MWTNYPVTSQLHGYPKRKKNRKVKTLPGTATNECYHIHSITAVLRAALLNVLFTGRGPMGSPEPLQSATTPTRLLENNQKTQVLLPPKAAQSLLTQNAASQFVLVLTAQQGMHMAQNELLLPALGVYTSLELDTEVAILDIYGRKA